MAQIIRGIDRVGKSDADIRKALLEYKQNIDRELGYDVKKVILTNSDRANMAVESEEYRRKLKGIPMRTGFPYLDQIFEEVTANDFITILGQTFNGKSVLTRMIKDNRCDILKSLGVPKYRRVVMIDLENTFEYIVAGETRLDPSEFETFELPTRYGMGVLRGTKSNLILVAFTEKAQGYLNHVTSSLLTKMLYYIQDGGVTNGRQVAIDSIFVDYLQAIAASASGDAKDNIKGDTEMMYSWRGRFSCPVWVASQGTMGKLDAPKTLYVPNIYEHAWTRHPALRATRQLAVWTPHTMHDAGLMSHELSNGRQWMYHVNANTMIIELQKQRARARNGRKVTSLARFKCFVDWEGGWVYEMDNRGKPIIGEFDPPYTPPVVKDSRKTDEEAYAEYLKHKEEQGITEDSEFPI